MSKKLFLLICFVLVLCLGSNVLALDMVQPDFAGGEQTAAVLWEFEDGNSVTKEASDKPSLILYSPEPPDACFGFRTYGSDYEGGCDPNNSFQWDSNGTVVCIGEESVAQPIPLGDGANLTVQVQVTWQGPNFPEPCGPGIGFELWGGYPERPDDCEVREGEWLGGVFNEEAIEVAPIAEVNNVEGAWRHTTYLYTFSGDDFPEETTHFNVLFFGFVSGTAGMRIDEVVIDMVVHDGEAPTGPGRPWMLIPRAGQVRNPVPANLEKHVLPTTNLSWEPDPCLAGPLTYDVWFGTDPNMANNTKIASNIGPCTVDPCAGDLAAGTVFYWRVDTSTPGREGIDFKFTTWGLADDVYPADGAKGVDPPVLLEWGPDGYAASCDIYLGTSFAEVDNADTDTTGIYKGNQAVSDVNYNAGMLDLLKDYYWRIDEKNGSGTAIKGEVWRFTTGNYFVVDDFDGYVDTDPDLYAVWDDYWVNLSGAAVFVEKDANNTRDGNSMLYLYDSTWKDGPTCVGSVADTDTTRLGTGSDWTVGGVKALVLYFLGDAGNSTTANDRMWLEIEDTSSNAGLVLYDGDVNNLAVTDEWQEWNINLEVYDACGVSLANVDKIHLGFGGPTVGGDCKAGGTGTVYFDDIQLHPRRCRPDVVAWDIAGDDCKTDGFDIEAMSADWLVKDYEVIPVAPDRNDLLVEYLFATDGNYNDTSGNDFHGQPTQTLTHVANGYLTIEAAGGHVDIPFGASNPFHGPNDFSVVMEYRSSAVATMFLMTSTDPCLGTDWEDPNIEAALSLYSPMGLIMEQEHEGGPSNPDDLYFVYDQFWRNNGGTDVYKSEAGGIGAWHTVAATYDADGGKDANGLTTGLVTVYIDGVKGAVSLAIDPNIPQDPNYDIVRIGDASNPLHADDWGAEPLIGDFNEILIYDAALSEAEVYYLSGIVDPTYVANTSLANVVPKSPPGGPYDADNIDIVNFIDFNLLGEHWLEAPLLWP